MFRKLLPMVLAVIVCMSLSTTAFAADLKKPQERDTISVVSSNEKLDALKWHDYHSLDTFTYKNRYKLQPRFRVGLEYTSGVASPNRIVSLGNAVMYTGAGSKCSFAGTLGYELIVGNEFYYDFFGDIYRKGNIQWLTGLTVGIGKGASIQGSISNGNCYVTNVSDSETYYSEVLNS